MSDESAELDWPEIVERLRDLTARYEATDDRITNDPRGPDDMPPGERFAEDFIIGQDSQLRRIEDEAIRAIDSVYRDEHDYSKVVELIEQADAGWLFEVFLWRSIETVGAP